MKKLFLSVLAISALSSAAFAYDRVGIDFGIGTNSTLSFDTYYKHYNDYDNFVYKADLGYSNTEEKFLNSKYKWTAVEIGGLVGKAFYLPIADFDGGLNILAGAKYYNWSSKIDGYGFGAEYKYSGFGIKGGANYSVNINEKTMLEAEAFLNIDFGDISSTYLTTALIGSYKFTNNLYASIRLGYTGTYITSSGVAIGIGYEF